MNKSTINVPSAGTAADSDSTAQNQQVSQPNANTNVVCRLSDVLLQLGNAHHLFAKSSLSKEEYEPISSIMATAHLELFKIYKEIKMSPKNIIELEDALIKYKYGEYDEFQMQMSIQNYCIAHKKYNDELEIYI